MVSGGGNHTCGIRAGTLYCWGFNNDGQVGLDSSGADVHTPTRITSAQDWKSVSAGAYHTCAIRSIGKLYCWGNNAYDQVGFNTAGVAVKTPTKITSADDWKSVDAGTYHTCAIRSAGKLYCWGFNYEGRVGFDSGGANVPTPTKITSADDWKTVRAGGAHTCAIRSAGKLYCWGYNPDGRVGFNTLGVPVTTPTKVTSADDWKTVTAGYADTCAIRSIGKLYCWGYNNDGEAGFNSGGNNVLTPTRITSAEDWKAVSSGNNHSCAIRSIGKLYCWGYNAYDQVGFNSEGNNVLTPTRITSAEDWKTTSAGGLHSCAIRSVGKLYCWGLNGDGQLGFSSGGPVPTPTQVTSP